MPLTLVSTVGGATANSYVTQADAVAAALYRFGPAVTAWSALTSDQQIQTLVTAARDIDTLEQTVGFKGTRASSTQALEWPRTGTSYASTVIPVPLATAQIELAFSYAPAFAAGATGDVLSPDERNGNIKREKVSVIETEYFSATEPAAEGLERFPSIVQRLLASLVRAVAAAGYGTSYAVRTS